MHGSQGVVSEWEAAIWTLEKPIRKVAVQETGIPTIVGRNGPNLRHHIIKGFPRRLHNKHPCEKTELETIIAFMFRNETKSAVLRDLR